MTRFVYETEQADLALLPVFERNAGESIERATEWCRGHPDDAEGLMVLGASYGIAARISALRHNWLTAYFQGRKAIRYTRAAERLDPSLGDPWLGIGMYDYYTDTYPRFVGVLAKLLLHGDRKRGVAGLRRAAQHGRYVNTAAKLLIVEVYTEDRYGERDPEEAVRIMADVRSAYPGSLMLQAAELFALYEAKRYDAALAGCDEFLQKAAKLRIAPIQTAKGRHIQGTTLWAMGRRKEAEAALREGAETLLAGGPTMWAVWSRIRLARLLDLEGRRPEALEQYRLAAAAPDHWDLEAVAEAGISKPWKDPYPGHLSPF
jgi:tetratricopeptide (TPR) repeat protein